VKKTYAMIVLCLVAVVPVASGQILNEDSKLSAFDGKLGDLFGTSVSISGDTVVVGAMGDTDNFIKSGSAYVFNAGTGVLIAKLLSSDRADHDSFGISASLSGDTMVIGASTDDDDGLDSGSAYVFTRSGDVWTQHAKLTASDGAAFDNFGESVAIDSDTVVIGSRWDDDFGLDTGSAYVFDAASGEQIAKLLPSQGVSDALFGVSVSISGDTIVVGAAFEDANGTDSGAVYVFTRDGDIWTQQAKLFQDDASADDRFGSSVSMRDDTLVIGAYGVDDFPNGTGSAYVFKRINGVWTQQVKLLPNGGSADDGFGLTVYNRGDIAVVGARLENSGTGSAYMFNAVTGVQIAKLLPSDPASNGSFGADICMRGRTAVIGSYGAQVNGSFRKGAAYVYDLPHPCPGDIADEFSQLNPDGIVGFGDFQALLGLVGPCPGGTPPPPGCDGDIADDFGTLNGGDGMVSFGDFLALLGLVGPCP